MTEAEKKNEESTGMFESVKKKLRTLKQRIMEVLRK